MEYQINFHKLFINFKVYLMPEENISSNIPLTPLETRLEVNFLSDEENCHES